MNTTLHEGQSENCIGSCRICNVYVSLEHLMSLLHEAEAFEKRLLESKDNRLVELANEIHDIIDTVKAEPLV